MDIKLVTDKIKWISQLGAEAGRANNDCGAASAAMVISTWSEETPSVDEIYEEISKTDRYLSVSEIMEYLSQQGIKTDYSRNSSITALQEKLSEGNPVIILFNYKTYRQHYKTDTGFSGAHFAVVAGFDTRGFVMFDPLAFDTTYGIVHVLYEHFNEMWTDANKQGNSARSMLVAYEPEERPEEPEEGEDALRVRILTDALRIRSTPQVNGKNYTRRNAHKGQVFPVLDTEQVSDREIWIKIGKDEWVALMYQGQTYAVLLR